RPDGPRARSPLTSPAASCTTGPPSTAPATTSADPDCTNTGCNFGTPLPIPNPTIPGITSCVLNTWNAAASGTLDLSTGASQTAVPLNSDTYLTGNLGQPCPKCSATGTPSSPGTGTCDRGPRAGMACTTTSSTGYAGLPDGWHGRHAPLHAGWRRVHRRLARRCDPGEPLAAHHGHSQQDERDRELLPGP